MLTNTRRHVAGTLLVLAFLPDSLLAQIKKPHVVKRTKIVIVDGKESYRVPMAQGVTTTGIQVVQTMIDSQIERRISFPDGTFVRARDHLKIKTTMPLQRIPPDRVCNTNVLETATIHGVKANLIDHEGKKGWVAPTLNCAMLRAFNTLPPYPAGTVTQNKIETESIEFKEPPKEWISVANLEELPPSEFELRVRKAKGNLSEEYLKRMREKMKQSNVDDPYYRTRTNNK